MHIMCFTLTALSQDFLNLVWIICVNEAVGTIKIEARLNSQINMHV